MDEMRDKEGQKARKRMKKLQQCKSLYEIRFEYDTKQPLDLAYIPYDEQKMILFRLVAKKIRTHHGSFILPNLLR